MKRHMTARARLETFAHVSRTQSEQETYDMAVSRDVELKRLRAEVERLRADAERYRWLRDKGNWRLYILQLPPRQMDAAIDAARTEGKG